MATAPVNLGLIGLGNWWESRFRPALAKLESRLKVVAIYDNVLVRADQTSREIGAKSMAGATDLIDRSDIQAIMILDAGWPGANLLRLVCERRKPVLWATRCDLPISELQSLYRCVVSHGHTVMPAFPKRCSPASNRLQELMATQLGRPLRVDVSIAPASLQAIPFATNADVGGHNHPPLDPMMEWADWCCYLFRGSPDQTFQATKGQGVRLEFRPTATESNSELRIAELVLSPTAPLLDQPTFDEVYVICERGEARLRGPSEVDWTTNGITTAESLESERSDIEVLLDQFCRRVVGGLIPVPDLSDLYRARLAAIISE